MDAAAADESLSSFLPSILPSFLPSSWFSCCIVYMAVKVLLGREGRRPCCRCITLDRVSAEAEGYLMNIAVEGRKEGEEGGEKEGREEGRARTAVFLLPLLRRMLHCNMATLAARRRSLDGYLPSRVWHKCRTALHFSLRRYCMMCILCNRYPPHLRESSITLEMLNS